MHEKGYPLSTDRTFHRLLLSLPERSREEIRTFLAFSERPRRLDSPPVREEILVSLASFSAATLRPN